jgi:hypothetical protein
MDEKIVHKTRFTKRKKIPHGLFVLIKRMQKAVFEGAEKLCFKPVHSIKYNDKK